MFNPELNLLMTIQERIAALYRYKHALTSQMCRETHGTPVYQELEQEYEKTKGELNQILQELLSADKFRIESVTVDKARASVTLTNDALVVPTTLYYKDIKLTDFPRKPGAKQAAQREKEILATITPEAILAMHKISVGTSRFEVAKNYGWITFITDVKVVA